MKIYFIHRSALQLVELKAHRNLPELPYTDSTTGDLPSGDQSCICVFSAANFMGLIAYYVPEPRAKSASCSTTLSSMAAASTRAWQHPRSRDGF